MIYKSTCVSFGQSNWDHKRKA